MDIAPNEQPEQNISEVPAKLTVNDVDVDFLPLIYEIIRSVDREPHDTQKAGQSSDISQKVLELHKKFELAREQVRRLPGVEYSKEEQLDKLETLHKQLRLKRELVLKYRNMYSFDVPKVTRLSEQAIEKLADSAPMRRAARFLVRIFQESKTILPPGTTPQKLKEEFLKSDKLQDIARKAKEEFLKSDKLQDIARKAKEELEKRTKRF